MFSYEKRHKMAFSLVFLLKTGKIHFSDYLRNPLPYPLLYILLFAVYMSMQATYIKK